MSWIKEHRGAAVPIKPDRGGLALHAGLAVLLFGGTFAGVWFWRGGPMQGTIAGDLSAKATAMTHQAMAEIRSAHAPPATPAMTPPSRPPLEAQDAASQARRAFARQLDAAVKPSDSGARLGTRALATYLRSCGKAFQIADLMLGTMPGDKSRKIPDTPQGFEARFVMLEAQLRSSTLFTVGAIQERPGKVSGAHVHGMAADQVADFVACALARPTTDMCNADNRAAALSLLSSYFTVYARGEAELQKFDPVKRYALEKLLKPQRHGQIERQLANHARAGTIMAGDVGWFANARVKEIVGEWTSVGDGCVTTRDA